MQYEYQRASHEVTVHEAAKIRYENLQTRYSKRVEKMESIFTKRKNQLSTDYKSLQSQASANISSATGGSAAAFEAMLGSIIIGGHSLGDYIDCSSASSLSGSDLLRELSSLAQKANAALQTLIQAAQDADTERLEDQEEQMLDPIREKDTEMEAKSNLEQTLTTVWDERKEAAKQRLGQDVKGAFGGFTLGG